MDNHSGLLFTNARIVGSIDTIPCGWLSTKNNKITAFGAGDPPQSSSDRNVNNIDCTGCVVLPGFIDIHTHGALGSDFNVGSLLEISQISSFYAAHGVTSFLTTTYAASPEETSNAITTIKNVMGQEPGARILGIHLEGPWLNPIMAGAQSKTSIRTAIPEEVIPYLDTGLIRLVTLAPEIQQNQWLIKACRERGIIVSAGHTNATFKEMQTALNMGITQVTHCFNALRPLHHREPGVVGAALTIPEFYCELIADTIHVHPAMMNLLVKAKSPDKVILITDSISAAGMPDGTYLLEGQSVTCENDSARLVDGTLAGSTLTMDAALCNLLQATREPLEKLWCCSSQNAAVALKIGDRKGKIAPGFDADLVVLDTNLHVQMTVVDGKIVFDSR